MRKPIVETAAVVCVLWGCTEPCAAHGFHGMPAAAHVHAAYAPSMPAAQHVHAMRAPNMAMMQHAGRGAAMQAQFRPAANQGRRQVRIAHTLNAMNHRGGFNPTVANRMNAIPPGVRFMGYGNLMGNANLLSNRAMMSTGMIPTSGMMSTGLMPVSGMSAMGAGQRGLMAREMQLVRADYRRIAMDQMSGNRSRMLMDTGRLRRNLGMLNGNRWNGLNGAGNGMLYGNNLNGLNGAGNLGINSALLANSRMLGNRRLGVNPVVGVSQHHVAGAHVGTIRAPLVARPTHVNAHVRVDPPKVSSSHQVVAAKHAVSKN